ncbi:hypothetical protein HDA45_006496 [Amycolatopsis umgeniensis]|uniref:Uncharacterized protein n=1 Tax=Amycolatopsis umgeniensis TaxID=336628 RepID=A0A841B5Y5_9PSEU|nr:hypothetical protein [Amycolatopsis umgeniensis]
MTQCGDLDYAKIIFVLMALLSRPNIG